MKDFYEEVLGVKLRFEWQHRGSPHVHGLAWLGDAPSIEQGAIPETSTMQEITRYVDNVVSTVNPAIHEDGSNASDAPLPQVDPHVCNRPFAAIENYEEDLKELIATCQRHTRCSPSYCLKTKHGQQQCPFGYPKPLQQVTTLTRNEDGDIELLTKRNDPLINSFNPIQLSAWRDNVDMQYCISKNKVIAYCTKYATKSEPRSVPLKQVYKSVVGTLKDDDHALKAVHRLLTNSVGERDYSAQETCHLLLQLPLTMSTREFVYLTLDGTRMVEEKLNEDEPATIKSCLDNYISRPTSHQFESCTLQQFAENYSTPRQGEPKPRNKKVVVILRPHISPDPDGQNYEQYCKQRLMLYKPFRNETELLSGHESFTEAYADYLSTGNAPSCLWDDIHRLQQATQGSSNEDEDNDEGEAASGQGSRNRSVEEWMLICHHRAQLVDNEEASTETVDWLEAARRYPNLEEAPTFIVRSKESYTPRRSSSNSPDSRLLQGKQLEAYETVLQHYQQQQLNMNPQPLRMIVSGTAGTGKSFLICCLEDLLQGKVRLLAPTGVAAFNIHGCTSHSVLHLPTKGELKNLEGDALRSLQDSLAGVEYIIIDEMSMVGRKMFGQIDHRLRQAFPQCADQVLGGRSCLLIGDFGQLPPVMDLPLYTSVSRSSISDLGRSAYQTFDKAIVLTQVMRQSGQDEEQVRFREIFLRLRDASVTKDDWEHLMTRRDGQIANKDNFSQALHLFPTVNAVAEYKLRHNGQPVAETKAIHSGPRASTAASDDAGGLDPVVHIAQGARVMLTSNLWVHAGLVNGAMGTVQAICYQSGGPPALPTAVMVKFDSYSGPTMHDGSVPIVPIRRSWMSGGATCSRLQLPLKLAWAVTIHKSQGLTLGKAVVDIGSKEFCAGLTFVACSRVRCLSDLMFSPGFDFDRISSIANNVRLQERKAEDSRLQLLQST